MGSLSPRRPRRARDRCSRCRRRPPPAPSRASSTARCRRRRGRRRSRCTTAFSSRRAASAPARSSARAGSSPPATASRTTPATSAPRTTGTTRPTSARSRVGSIARTSGGSAITVDQVIRHESYNDTTLDHDLALLHLASAVPEEPLRLIGSGDSPLWGPGVQATVIGWGVTENGVQSNSQLLEAKMPMLSDATCAGPQPTGWARSSRRRRWCAPAAARPTPAGATPAGR